MSADPRCLDGLAKVCSLNRMLRRYRFNVKPDAEKYGYGVGKDYELQDCPIARALELVGERWTILVIRDCFLGVRRFNDFLAHLDIPRQCWPTDSTASSPKGCSNDASTAPAATNTS